MSVDYSSHVVEVGILARKLQAASAHSANKQEIFDLATDIMLECQRIRDYTQDQPLTLKDYINKIL